MERMQGQMPKMINPLDKGYYMNIIEFFLPLFTWMRGKAYHTINLPPMTNMMAPRNSKDKAK